MREVRERLLRRLPDVKSIILHGSLSTGDFSVIRNDDGWRFISDIDLIAVVSPAQFLRERLRSSKYCGRLADGTSIDVSFETAGSLRKAPNIMDYRNLFESGVVIYGHDPLEQVPPSFLRPLSLGQGLRLLCNRLWGILEGLCPEDRGVLLLHRLKKGALACFQAELILKGRFETLPERVLSHTEESGISSFLKTYLQEELSGRKPLRSEAAKEELLLPVLGEIYRGIRDHLSALLNIETDDWKTTIPMLPEVKWPTGPFPGHCINFILRRLLRKKALHGVSLLRSLRNPPCIRIWSGWMALGLSILRAEERSSFLDVYNGVMRWFPDFRERQGLEDIIRHNLVLQQGVPVTSRI